MMEFAAALELPHKALVEAAQDGAAKGDLEGNALANTEHSAFNAEMKHLAKS